MRHDSQHDGDTATVPGDSTHLTRLSDWRERLASIVATMKEISLQDNPQEMVRVYGQRMQQLLPVDRRISLSRRGLKAPQFKVTRFSGWDSDVNPWRDGEQLPIYSGGLLSELLYSDEPRIIDDLQLPESDPAYPYLVGQRSLVSLPLFDHGVAMNAVIITQAQPDAFRPEDLPERVWMANLFGRATHNLVLAEQLEAAYRDVDRELQAVADIQRSLLPADLPVIETLNLASYYQTSKRAGGDYYDFFPLPQGRWGILVADVSGHGTPAAVVMAITHCIAHLHCDEVVAPSRLLQFLNHHLTSRYTASSGHFVTAFYGIYDPASRHLTYACAGHNPPRLQRKGLPAAMALDQANSLPLGIMPGLDYHESEIHLVPGDRLILYTDGITEAGSMKNLFGVERLDAVFARDIADPREALEQLLREIDDFTEGAPAEDDRTVIVMDVR